MSNAQKDFDSDQYKAVDKAEGYKTFFNSSLLQFELIDKPSFKRLIGSNLQGKSVIDYGCGNGGATKFLADLGPSKLVGVDLSETMIDMAIKDCKSNPNYFFVDFYVRDCSKPVDLGHFDIVFSRYFLHYGQTKEMLFDMIKSMFESTKPGGMCAGYMADPLTNRGLNFSQFYKYNIEINRVNEVEVYVRMYDGEAKKSNLLRDLHVWFWPPQLYEEFFKQVGFQDFQWIEPHLESDDQIYKDHFKDFFKPHLMYTLFKANRPLNLI